jgi:hypothetical protein
MGKILPAISGTGAPVDRLAPNGDVAAGQLNATTLPLDARRYARGEIQTCTGTIPKPFLPHVQRVLPEFAPSFPVRDV